MSTFKNIMLWIAVGLLFILACGTGIVGFLFGMVAIALILPINKWQKMLCNFINRPIKIIALILAIILMFSVATGVPETDIDTSSDMSSTISQVIETSSEEKTATTSSLQSDTSSKVIESDKETEDNELKNNSSVESETHIHVFTNATCTVPAQCSCGETNGLANGHSWSNATCEMPKICTVCQAKDGVAEGHKYLNGSCTICGAQDFNYTPPETNVTTYVLNLESKKFHLPSCYKLPKENRKDTTKSRQEIIDEGYEPCKICNP